MTETSLPTAGGVVRSTDYQGQGATVRSTKGIGGTRNVQEASQVADSDIVVIDGMEMKASMARELGLMGKVFDEGLSVGATARAAQSAPKATQSGTGNAEYDAAVAGLEESIEAGTMEVEEAQGYDTAVGEVALSGLSIEDAVATLDGMADGSVNAMDVSANVKATLASAEAKVTEAATKSAQRELGAETFGWLQRAASTHPGVNRSIRAYALDRATGRAGGVTWSDFAAHIRQELGA
jgi:hypothetical protein